MDQSGRKESGGVALWVKQLLLTAVIVGAATAAAAGLFDPRFISACSDFQPSQIVTIESNSHSHTTSIFLEKNSRALNIVITGNPTDSDYEARLASGDFLLRLNPVGYAGLASAVDFAPFPHVAQTANDITLVFEDGRQIREVWINRERFWEGSTPGGESVSVAVQNHHIPLELKIETCLLADG